MESQVKNVRFDSPLCTVVEKSGLDMVMPSRRVENHALYWDDSDLNLPIALNRFDELDYPDLARLLGGDSVPHLGVIAQGPDPMLASKAIYLTSLIGGDAAREIVSAAARHDDPVRRVAAASGIANLTEPAAVALTETHDTSSASAR